MFSFGVVADVQYADQPATGARAYRESLAKLEQCGAALSRERLAFTIQLGDLVDGGLANLDRILPVWNRLPGPRYHVLGNHDLGIPREILLKRLGMRRAYYDFRVRNWRFLVLDGLNASGREAEDLLARVKREGAPNAQTWNGALGRSERDWLLATLADAARRRQRAVVFCHLPVLAESCRPEHLLWDHAEALSVLDSEPALAAWFAGHDHRGGYALRKGAHYVTVAGMVEHDAASSCKVVDVFPGRLVLRQAGAAEGQTLSLAYDRVW